MAGLIMGATGFVVKSVLSDQVSTKPHWTFYVGVAATSAALLAAATATVAMAVLAMTTQLITVGVCSGLICGAMFLMTIYLYRFSRDHNIVKAGLAQAEALRRAHNVTGELRETIEAEKVLVKQLKNKEFAQGYVASTRTLKATANALLEALNKHKQAQEKSLQKAREYTKGVAQELEKHDKVLTATNKKQQQLLEKIGTYESGRKEINLSLEELIDARAKGRDLLEEIRGDLEEGVKCLRRYAKLAETIQTDSVEQKKINEELRQLLKQIGSENKKQKQTYEEMKPLLEKLTQGKGGDS